MRPRPYSRSTLSAMLGLAILAGAGSLYAGPVTDRLHDAMRAAAQRMARATTVVRDARIARGLQIDLQVDPNQTGLIGVESSPITTTLGDLASKRTSTNPNMAAGVVRWLAGAGVRSGDVVAVGASGSFPGLIIATVAAAHALNAEPVVVSSVAASSWGANHPDFTWLEMEAALVAAALAPRSVAVSAGGDADAGGAPGSEARALLEHAIARSGIPPVGGETLPDRVARRMAVYDRAARGRPIAAFVNVGGAAANIGTCLEILAVTPGVHRALPACRGQPGVLWVMHERQIPVVHLLHVGGIARAFRLPLDPVPLPLAGRGAPFAQPPRAVAAGLLAALVAGLALIAGRSWAAPRAGRR